MTRLPKGWREGHGGDLACPHRDCSVCPPCAASRPEAVHWSREKSADHVDCEVRHLIDRGGSDEVKLPSGEVVRVRHSAERAWRALADLQLELEAEGAPLARGALEPSARLVTRCSYPGCRSDAYGPYCLEHKIGSGG